jgi:hypothetical protein
LEREDAFLVTLIERDAAALERVFILPGFVILNTNKAVN